MLFLGIDPGIRKLGYALVTQDLSIVDAGILVDDHHDIRDRNHQYDRMCQISVFFDELLKTHPGIKAVGIEQLFFTKYNQQNAEFVYGMRGILCTKMTQHQIQIHEFTPPQLKLRITGNGKAGKQLVQQMIMKRFGLASLPRYHDAADALGLAYLGLIAS